MSTATSTAADGVDGDASVATIGPFRAVWWALEQLASSPALLLLAAVVGSIRAVSVSMDASSATIATVPFELYPVALIYGFVGYEYGDFLDLHDVVFYEIFGAIRLGLLGLVFGGALFVSTIVLLPLGYLGFFVLVLVWALLLVNVLLLAPAVCIDEGVISGIGKGWALADEARWTVFGLLVLTGIPTAIVQTSIENPDVVAVAAVGLGLGFVNTVSHLALGRIYVGQRS